MRLKNNQKMLIALVSGYYVYSKNDSRNINSKRTHQISKSEYFHKDTNNLIDIINSNLDYFNDKQKNLMINSFSDHFYYIVMSIFYSKFNLNVEGILEMISKDYDLDKDELINKYLKINLDKKEIKDLENRNEYSLNTIKGNNIFIINTALSVVNMFIDKKIKKDKKAEEFFNEINEINRKKEFMDMF